MLLFSFSKDSKAWRIWIKNLILILTDAGKWNMDRDWSPLPSSSRFSHSGGCTSGLVHPRMPSIPQHGSSVLVLWELLNFSVLAEMVAVVLQDTTSVLPCLSTCPGLNSQLTIFLGSMEEHHPVSLILQTGGFHGVLVTQLGSYLLPLKKEPQRISYLTHTWMSNSFLTPSHPLGTVSTTRTKTSSVFGGGML